MGIMLIYQTSQPESSIWNSVAISFGVPYFSISLSLNILLTLLIVAWLAMHRKDIRNATGAPAGASGLYETIVAVFVESCAIYAVISLLFVVPWGAKSHVADIFLPILAEVQVRFLFVFPQGPSPSKVRGGRGFWSESNTGDKQVIAPLLVVRRVAHQSPFVRDPIAPGTSRPGRKVGGGGGDGLMMDTYQKDPEGEV